MRLHFTLRRMLVLVGVVGLAFGALMWCWRRHETQRQLVELILDARGEILYGEPVVDLPEWLVPLIGYHCLHPIEYIDLMSDWDPPLSTEYFDQVIMPPVSRLTSLTVFSAFGHNLTDRGLFQLRGHETLEFLCVTRTKVSIAGVAALKPLPRLRHLDARDIQATPQEWATLGPCFAIEHLTISPQPGIDFSAFKNSGLRHLDCDHGEIGDDELKGITQLATLERLDTVNTKITAKGVNYLKPLNKLYNLSLFGADLGDEAVPSLKQLNLQWIHLARTKLTDRGLAELMQMPSLQGVDVSYTEVSAEFADQLRVRYPKIRIAHHAASDWRHRVLPEVLVGSEY